MKLRTLLLTLVALALPSLAHAQYPHASFFNGGTTLTATCTNLAAASVTSSDQFTGIAQGNTTVTLPTAATGCHDYDVIDLRFTQAASQSYTLTVAAGTGTAVTVVSNGGVLIAAPAGAASGAANILHQIWVYNAVATTPQWELVTQETIPSASISAGPSLGVNGAPDGTAGDLRLFKTAGDTQPVVLCGNGLFGAGGGCQFGSGGSTAISAGIGFNVNSTDIFDNGGYYLNIGPGLLVSNATSSSLNGGGTIQAYGGALPTLTTGCGAANANTGSTNNSGSVTTGTTETTCTLAFSAAGTWKHTPHCICGDGSAEITPLGCSVGATSTSSVVFDFASATGKTFNYICF